MDLDLAAVRHLLSHLGSIPKLRQNALVRDWLESTDATPHVVQARVREIVSSALETTLAGLGPKDAARAERWRAIVHGCDLRGELQKVVGDQLGICTRHLQRERRAAHEAIAGCVLRELNRLRSAASPLRDLSFELETQVEYAAALRNFGCLDEAARMLEEVADSPCSPLLRMQAITDRLDPSIGGGDASTAVRLIGVARSIATTSLPSPEVEAELLTVETYALSATPGAAYVQQIERVLHHVRSLPPSKRTSTLGTQASLALTLYLSDLAGNIAEAERALAVARSFLDQCPVAQPTLASMFYRYAGDVFLVSVGPQKASEAFGKALTISKEHQAPYEVARASYLLAHACYQRGDLREAERHGRNALALTSRLNCVSGAAAAEALLAEVYLDRGEAQSALTWSTLSGARPLREEFWRSVFTITTAAALDQLGQSEDALKIIDRSCSTMERSRSWRFLGIGECVRAQVYAHADRPKDANAAIGRAIELLERYGMVASLARAYDVSARLTKNMKHRTRARELREYLTQ